MVAAVPLTVLTGFLGSGKTTLLKRLLQTPSMSGTAVLINEFGEVGIDDALVEKVDEDAVLLPPPRRPSSARGATPSRTTASGSSPTATAATGS